MIGVVFVDGEELEEIMNALADTLDGQVRFFIGVEDLFEA